MEVKMNVRDELEGAFLRAWATKCMFLIVFRFADLAGGRTGCWGPLSVWALDAAEKRKNEA